LWSECRSSPGRSILTFLWALSSPSFLCVFPLYSAYYTWWTKLMRCILPASGPWSLARTKLWNSIRWSNWGPIGCKNRFSRHRSNLSLRTQPIAGSWRASLWLQ
jgi:hypothetical protein